jgi:hypothetical protein
VVGVRPIAEIRVPLPRGALHVPQGGGCACSISLRGYAHLRVERHQRACSTLSTSRGTRSTRSASVPRGFVEQPALGSVYKLVEVNGEPCIKLSQGLQGCDSRCKSVYRLIEGMVPHHGPAPENIGTRPGTRCAHSCRHPFEEARRAFVTPARVEALQQLVGTLNRVSGTIPDGGVSGPRCIGSATREDIRPLNPTPQGGCVAVSASTSMSYGS